MNPYSNSALEKKLDDIAANHVANPKQELLPGIFPIWHSELRAMDIPPPSYLVDGLVSKGGINAISGISGSHKTWLVFDMAVAVASGTPFLGTFPTKRTKVMIYDEESGRGRIKQRLDRLSDKGLDIVIVTEQHLKIDTSGVPGAIIAFCQANGIGLLIVDSLTCIHTASENSNQEMSAVFEHFQRIAQAGITVLIIHHEPKSSNYNPTYASLRGAGDILAKCDIHTSIRHKYSHRDDVVKVKQPKNRDDDRLPDFEVNVHKEATKTWFEYVAKAPAPNRKSKDELAEEAIFAYLREHGRSAKVDIEAALSGTAGQAKVANMLNTFAASHKLTPSIGDHEKKYFDLPKDPTPA